MNIDDCLNKAQQWICEGATDRAVQLLQRATEQAPHQPELWKLLGIACHEEQLEPEAVTAFTQACALNPRDIDAIMMLAQSSQLAGLPALEHFERLLALIPDDLNARRGYAAALAADNQREAADTLLCQSLQQHPDWLAGHKALSSLRYTSGDHTHFADSYASACSRQPGHLPLWLEWFRSQAQVRAWDNARRIIAEAEAFFGPHPQLDLAKLFIASESGDQTSAERLFEQTSQLDDLTRDLALIRHLLRKGDAAPAETVAMRRISSPAANVIWPYLSLIWRLTGNEYAHWLDGEPLLVHTMDLAFADEELNQLAGLLRQLHQARSPFAEQSVRGGTQTDQHLFLRHEPILRALKNRMQSAVASYVAQLPSGASGHPILGAPREQLIRGRMQFAGSWSVRLTAQGHNVSHTHPQGLISSALYISLPKPEQMGPTPAGWIQFGTPPSELNLPLAPLLNLEPKVGRLVVFPSTLWHSTVPFNDGERLVVAFDVRPPRH